VAVGDRGDDELVGTGGVAQLFQPVGDLRAGLRRAGKRDGPGTGADAE
jgi:hypothetical protein